MGYVRADPAVGSGSIIGSGAEPDTPGRVRGISAVGGCGSPKIFAATASIKADLIAGGSGVMIGRGGGGSM